MSGRMGERKNNVYVFFNEMVYSVETVVRRCTSPPSSLTTPRPLNRHCVDYLGRITSNKGAHHLPTQRDNYCFFPF